MSYSNIIVTNKTSFSWNYPYTGGDIISDINDLTTSVVNATATMPPANDIDLGTSVTFNNISPSLPINIVEFGSLIPIVTIAQGSAVTIYLVNNTYASGVWRSVQLVGGSLGVTGVTLTTSSSALSISDPEITSGQSGTIDIEASPALNAISNLQDTGIVVVVNDNEPYEIDTVKLVSGNGIVITNPEGTNGDINIALNSNIGNLTQVSVGNITLANTSISSNSGLSISTNGKGNPLNLNGVSIDNNSNVIFPNSVTFTGSLSSPSFAKAWVVFNNIVTTTSSIVTILSSSGITDVEVTTNANSGYYTIIFATPFEDTNYGVLFGLGSSGTPPNISVRHCYVIAKQTTNMVIAIVDASGQLVTDAPDGVTVALISL